MRFTTIESANEAGWTTPRQAKDKGQVVDISGPSSTGYQYTLTLPDGTKVESETVYLSETVNLIGKQGSFLAMFPPVEA